MLPMPTMTPQYQRNYRKTIKPLKEREAKAEGYKEGVEACIRFLRQFIGDRAFTGHHSANLMRKAVSGPSGDIETRNRVILSLGGQPR